MIPKYNQATGQIWFFFGLFVFSFVFFVSKFECKFKQKNFVGIIPDEWLFIATCCKSKRNRWQRTQAFISEEMTRSLCLLKPRSQLSLVVCKFHAHSIHLVAVGWPFFIVPPPSLEDLAASRACLSSQCEISSVPLRLAAGHSPHL